MRRRCPLRGAIGGAPILARRISTARRRAGFLRGVAERSNAARHAACEWREPSGKGSYVRFRTLIQISGWRGSGTEHRATSFLRTVICLSKGGDYARAYRSDSGRHPRAVCGRVLPGQGDALTRNDSGGWKWRTAKYLPTPPARKPGLARFARRSFCPGPRCESAFKPQAAHALTTEEGLDPDAGLGPFVFGTDFAAGNASEP